MTLQCDARRGLLEPAAWTLVFVLALGTVRQAAAADDVAKAETQRLAAELQKAQEQNTALRAENQKLRADLKDEQLKNAIDVDQEVKRLRDLLRVSPAQVEAKKLFEDAKQQHSASLARMQAELEAAKQQYGADIKKMQAEVARNRDELSRKTANTKTQEERLAQLIEQVAALQREVAQPKPKPPEAPKPTPKVEPTPIEGPTPEQLKRLSEEFRRSPEAERERDRAEQGRLDAEERARAEQQLRREAEERLKQDRIATTASKVDTGRLEAEIRAARLEAQLQVMQMAYNDLRKETNRLREELDGERKARLEQSRNRRSSGSDPRIEQRLDHLEALVNKLSTVLDTLMKRVEASRPEK